MNRADKVVIDWDTDLKKANEGNFRHAGDDLHFDDLGQIQQLAELQELLLEVILPQLIGKQAARLLQTNYLVAQLLLIGVVFFYVIFLQVFLDAERKFIELIRSLPTQIHQHVLGFEVEADVGIVTKDGGRHFVHSSCYFVDSRILNLSRHGEQDDIASFYNATDHALALYRHVLICS